MGRTWMVANQPTAISAHGSQRAAGAPAARAPVKAIAPAATRGSDGRESRDAAAEAFLPHVEIDGAPDGGIHVGGRRPAEIAPCRLDVGHAHLDVLVILAVILAGRHLEDLGGARVLAQHRELLGDADGALRQIAYRDAVAGIADVEDTPARAPVLVLYDAQQAFDGVVDVGEGALL